MEKGYAWPTPILFMIVFVKTSLQAPTIIELLQARTGPKASWKFATWNPEMFHCFGKLCGHELVAEQCTKSIISYAMRANWKLKTSWEPNFKYKAWTNVRLLFLKWIASIQSLENLNLFVSLVFYHLLTVHCACIKIKLLPTYSVEFTHQKYIHVALSLLPVLTLCQYGTGRTVQFHRWFSQTLGRWYV